jgi:hypothetical protein
MERVIRSSTIENPLLFRRIRFELLEDFRKGISFDPTFDSILGLFPFCCIMGSSKSRFDA